MRSLGLDPAAIRYVLVTHGHWDHYGGATYLQQRYGARIGLSAADWDLMERSPPGSLARAPSFGPDTADRPPPRRDMVIADGQKLKLGNSELTLYVTPGHSPGTVSMLIPVREGRRRHVLSLLGGTAFPRTLEGDGIMGGLNDFDRSVARLSALSRRAGAVGTINTHVFVDGSDSKLAAIAATKGGPNPFVMGAAKVTRYYAMFRACLGAAKLRPQGANAGPPMPSKP
jgi:metallo-beta-lactamase class B